MFSILLPIFVTFGSRDAAHRGFNRYRSESLFRQKVCQYSFLDLHPEQFEGLYLFHE